LGCPPSLIYADRASAERDIEKLRAESAGAPVTYTIVEATPPTNAAEYASRFYSLAEEHIEEPIWRGVNAFNKQQISRGAPPATSEEIIRAVMSAVRYVMIYLDNPEDNADETSSETPSIT